MKSARFAAAAGGALAGVAGFAPGDSHHNPATASAAAADPPIIQVRRSMSRR